MYTNQALWTMAREELDIDDLAVLEPVLIGFLEGEMKGVGVEKPGHVAESMFQPS